MHDMFCHVPAFYIIHNFFQLFYVPLAFLFKSICNIMGDHCQLPGHGSWWRLTSLIWFFWFPFMSIKDITITLLTWEKFAESDLTVVLWVVLVYSSMNIISFKTVAVIQKVWCHRMYATVIVYVDQVYAVWEESVELNTQAQWFMKVLHFIIISHTCMLNLHCKIMSLEVHKVFDFVNEV